MFIFSTAIIDVAFAPNFLWKFQGGLKFHYLLRWEIIHKLIISGSNGRFLTMSQTVLVNLSENIEVELVLFQ